MTLNNQSAYKYMAISSAVIMPQHVNKLIYGDYTTALYSGDNKRRWAFTTLVGRNLFLSNVPSILDEL